MDLWEDGTFEVYLVQREGAQKERAEHWQIAIGSQDVVHLKNAISIGCGEFTCEW